MHIQTESELEATIKALNDEKQKLIHKAEALERQTAELAKDRAVLEQERYGLRVEKDKLEQVAMTVRQRSQDIDDMCAVSQKSCYIIIIIISSIIIILSVDMLFN